MRGFLPAWLLLALVLIGPGARAEPGIQTYWPLSAYLDAHPAQADTMAEFARAVAAPGRPATRVPDSPVRIAVIYPSLQVSDYWRRSVATLKARLAESGIPAELKVFESRPAVDLRRQSAQIAEALAWQPDFLIFTIDALRHRTLLDRLVTRPTPKIILQNITTPVRAWEDHQPLLYVGFDHETGARMLAGELVRRTGGRGRFVVLYGGPGHVSTMRGQPFLAEIAGHPEMTLVGAYYTDMDRERARRATRDALARHPDLTAIYAASTDIALGAADALAAAGRQEDVLLNGWGGGSAELAAIADGRIDFTVMRLNDDSSAAMAEAIRRSLADAAVPQVYAGEMAIVGRDTPPAEMDAYRRRAFRYSGRQ